MDEIFGSLWRLPDKMEHEARRGPERAKHHSGEFGPWPRKRKSHRTVKCGEGEGYRIGVTDLTPFVVTSLTWALALRLWSPPVGLRPCLSPWNFRDSFLRRVRHRHHSHCEDSQGFNLSHCLFGPNGMPSRAGHSFDGTEVRMQIRPGSRSLQADTYRS